MPIRPELRWFYPIDWPELSRAIRFGRVGGRCEACGRPHGQTVTCLLDGRWLDDAAGHWRNGRGRRCARPCPADLFAQRTTRSCSPPRIWTMTRRTIIRATSRACASAATCCTTGRTISPSAGSPIGCAWRSATCSPDRIGRIEFGGRQAWPVISHTLLQFVDVRAERLPGISFPPVKWRSSNECSTARPQLYDRRVTKSAWMRWNQSECKNSGEPLLEGAISTG